ncbi:hypothetical protein M426DRAFT_10979 [Hypoxylon sp. CI-4A]|nr:hypothetical protein M426DRAFT_10979 [Hypoxylon sp. CI-4A]
MDGNESGLSLAAREVLRERHISETGHRRRRQWFIAMSLFSLLPFIGLLVIYGKFNGSLIWWTEGEVRQLTIKQRGFIRNMLLFQSCFYVILISSIVAVFTRRP